MIFAIGEELIRRGVLTDIPLCAATAIYAAISSDTGSFRYTNTTDNTFAVAAALRGMGVDTADVSHRLFECKPYSQIKAEHLGFGNLQRWHGGRVAVIPFPYELKVKHEVSDADLETLVDVARSIEGVEIVLSVRQPTSEPRYRVSTRSSGAFCVAPLCARFGGGGHAKAAGCTIEAADMDEALSKLAQALEAELSAQNG